MKKIYLFLIAMVVVAGAFAQKANVDIKRGTDELVTLDGIEDEDVWGMIDPTAVEKNFTGEEPTVEAYWKAFYTEENIFILLNVVDDEHLPAWESGEANHWEWDKPEVYFDVNDVLVDGGGGANGGNGHFQYAPPFEEANYDVATFGADMGGVVEWCYSLTGEDYAVEYKFPISVLVNADGVVMDMSSLMALPEACGFDVTVIDRDAGDTGRKRKVWQCDGTIGEAWANMDGAGTITFTDAALVGVKDVASLSMDVYPNPVQDQLTIDGSFNKVVISNIIGQQVKVIETSSRTINVSDLSKGVYVVKAYDNGEYQGTAKVTKN